MDKAELDVEGGKIILERKGGGFLKLVIAKEERLLKAPDIKKLAALLKVI